MYLHILIHMYLIWLVYIFPFCYKDTYLFIYSIQIHMYIVYNVYSIYIYEESLAWKKWLDKSRKRKNLQENKTIFHPIIVFNKLIQCQMCSSDPIYLIFSSRALWELQQEDLLSTTWRLLSSPEDLLPINSTLYLLKKTFD